MGHGPTPHLLVRHNLNVEQTRYARSGGVHLAYRVRGEGPIDVVIPSLGTISIASFDEEPRLARFLRRLAGFARVILYDCRGVGLSDPLQHGDEASSEHAADDVVAVLDAVGSERAALLGWFAFGPVALTAAARHPDRIRALVLDNTWARLDRADDYPMGVPTEFLQASFDGATDVDESTTSGDAIWQALFPDSADDAALRLWWEDAGRRGASPTAARLLQHARFWADVRHLLPEIAAPTLVTHRRDSVWIRADHGRYLAEHLPAATYVEMDGGDQLFITTAGDRLAEAIEVFLTGTSAPTRVDRVLATVLFTDIVESTRRASELGDRRWRDLLDAHDSDLRSAVARFEGREVKSTGDGLLATFDSPRLAIECARAVSARLADLGLPIRAGIHTGEIEIRGDDIGGIAVHIGQRIQSLAGPGEVLVSRTVRDLVIGSSFEFEERGTHVLKGVPEAWQVFALTE